jgi:hypothetical protein
VNARGIYGARETLVCIVLLVCFILPGLLYYFDTSRVPRCSNCGKRVRKPIPPLKSP